MQEQTIDPSRSVVADAPVPPAGPLVSQLDTFAYGQVWPPHVHDQAHLMYTVNGVLEVTTQEGVWYVPPKQAIWIPPRIEHQARANGEATLQVVIIDLPSDLPCPQAATSMVLISPLLRELLRCLRRGGASYGAAELGGHVRALGFVAGFPFMETTPLPLQLPRRASPRARVPPHSLAIANAQTGIYPVAAPGGWNLLGRTLEAVYDPHRPHPGMRVSASPRAYASGAPPNSYRSTCSGLCARRSAKRWKAASSVDSNSPLGSPLGSLAA